MDYRLVPFAFYWLFKPACFLLAFQVCLLFIGFLSLLAIY